MMSQAVNHLPRGGNNIIFYPSMKNIEGDSDSAVPSIRVCSFSVFLRCLHVAEEMSLPLNLSFADNTYIYGYYQYSLIILRISHFKKPLSLVMQDLKLFSRCLHGNRLHFFFYNSTHCTNPYAVQKSTLFAHVLVMLMDKDGNTGQSVTTLIQTAICQ